MKAITRILLVIVALGLVGCGEGMRALNNPDGSGGLGFDVTNPDADDELNGIGDDALDAANELADQLNDDLANGKLDFDDILNSSGLSDIKDRFDDGLEPLFGALDDVKSKILELQARIQAEIDLLDPTIPEHAQAIAKLEKVMANLDRAIEKVDEVAEKILEQVNKLYAKIDELIAKIDNASLIWIIIKSEFINFNDNKVGGMRMLLLGLLAR